MGRPFTKPRPRQHNAHVVERDQQRRKEKRAMRKEDHMSNDFRELERELRKDFTERWKDASPYEVFAAYEKERHDAADALATLRADNERLRAALASDVELFKLLDRLGGLGYDKHDRITKALERGQAALYPELSERKVTPSGSTVPACQASPTGRCQYDTPSRDECIHCQLPYERK